MTCCWGISARFAGGVRFHTVQQFFCIFNAYSSYSVVACLCHLFMVSYYSSSFNSSLLPFSNITSSSTRYQAWYNTSINQHAERERRPWGIATRVGWLLEEAGNTWVVRVVVLWWCCGIPRCFEVQKGFLGVCMQEISRKGCSALLFLNLWPRIWLFRAPVRNSLLEWVFCCLFVVCIHVRTCMFGWVCRATCSFVSTPMLGISHAVQNEKKLWNLHIELL